MTFNRILLKILSIFLTAIILNGCGSSEESKTKYLEKAEVYLEQENYDKARIELKNVLQIDPKHAKAYYLLATIENKDRNWRKAFGFFNKAFELDSNNLSARTKLAEYYIAFKEFDVATEHIKAVLSKKPDDFKSRYLEIIIKYKKENEDDAIKEANDLIIHYPENTELAFFLSTAYKNQGDKEQSAKILIKSIEKNPDSTSLRVRLIQLYQSMGRVDNAEQLLHEVISIDPENASRHIMLASFYAVNKQFDKGEKVLRDIMQLNPNDAVRHLNLIDYIFKYGNRDRAVDELLAAKAYFPDDSIFTFALARIYVLVGKVDKSENVYKKIIDLKGVELDVLKARNELADLYIKQNKLGKAKVLSEEVLADNPRNNAALMIKGKLALSKRDLEPAIIAFRSILKDQSDLPEASKLLAKAHLLNNELGLAKEVLERSVEFNLIGPGARLNFAQYMIHTKDYSEAIKLLSEVLDIFPGNFNALKMRANLSMRRQDYLNAKSDLDKIKSIYPDNVEGYRALAQYYLHHRNYDEALVELELAYEKTISVFDLASIIQVYIAKGEFEKAIKRLNNALSDSDDKAEIHELLAETYMANKDYINAEKNLKEAIKLKPVWYTPYSNLAKVFQRTKELEKAESVFREFIDINGTEPASLKARNELANFYIKQNKEDDAKLLLEEVLVEIPWDNEALMMKGRLALSKRDMETAIIAFRSLLKEQPGSVEVSGLLANAHFLNNEYKQARNVLKEGLKANPDDVRLTFFLANIYEKEKNFDNALEIYESIIKNTDDDKIYDRAANNMASILSDYKGDPESLDKALNLVRRFESQQVASHLDTLGWIYFKKGEHKRAIELLSRAVENSPKVSIFQYHLGTAYYENGDKSNARIYLGKALESESEFIGKNEAQKILSQIQ